MNASAWSGTRRVILFGAAGAVALAVLAAAMLRDGDAITGLLNERNAAQVWHAGRDAYRQQDYAAAVEHYGRAVALLNEPDPQMQFDLARAAEKAEQLELAAENYDRACALVEQRRVKQPDHPLFYEPFIALAELRRRQGRRHDEYAAWQRLLALDPYYYAAHYYVGVYYSTERRTDEAIGHLQLCLQNLPETLRDGPIEGRCRMLLGDLLLGARRYTDALRVYQQAAALQPRNESLRYRLQQCRELIAAATETAESR